jgi:hypothetical protein
VVATFALGIGANTRLPRSTALLRPLPFPDADRLVRLSQKQQTSSETMIAPVRLENGTAQLRLQRDQRLRSRGRVETSGDLPERVRRAFVTPRMLDVWE